MEHTVVVAEIGECFNGDMEQARELIEVAAKAGCDYAKFQTLDTEGIAPDDPERDWFLKIALTEDRLSQLRQWCKEYDIRFLCTPEKTKNARELKELGCREVKIASTCLWDAQLLDYVAINFPVVFVSTGMSGLDEIDTVMTKLVNQERVYLMHCISEYPTGPLLEKRGLQALSPNDVRIAMMDILMERYPHAIVGYSDHTAGITAPIVAVARGARVIEKHITLDRETPVRNFKEGGPYLGTDHVLSLEPDELLQMVSCIREAEKMIGSAVWERTEGEKILMNFLWERFSH
jgi:sialic acid synthase SpsE